MQSPFHDNDEPLPLMRRLDRATRDMNPYLLALAVGLALLDLTCFATGRLAQSVPPRHLPGQDANEILPPGLQPPLALPVNDGGAAIPQRTIGAS
jgi:hypothetical protein